MNINLSLFNSNKNLVEQSKEVLSVFTGALTKLDEIEESIIARNTDINSQIDALKAERDTLTEQKKANWAVKKNIKAILGQ